MGCFAYMYLSKILTDAFLLARICIPQVIKHWRSYVATWPTTEPKRSYIARAFELSLSCFFLTSSPWTTSLSWLQHSYSCPLFSAGDFNPRVGRASLVFIVRSLIGLRTQDYKSLCVQLLRLVPPRLTL